MIDGLKLTFSGEELRTLLEEGIRRHDKRASRWTRETLRTKDDETEDAPLLPQHMCENEAERHTWRATVLAFIRDHVDAAESYRLGAADLEYGELLPERTDGTNNIDMTVGKYVSLPGDLRLQIRADAFNLFNTPQFAAPNGAVTSASFGRVTTQANSSREIQLGIKLYW